MTRTLRWSCSALLTIGWLGCSGSGGDELNDSLRGGDAAVDGAVEGGAAAVDAAPQEPEDAAPPQDAEPAPEDAGSAAAEDAALDATPIDAEIDAAESDAAVDNRNVLFAVFSGTLVRIDPDDATMREVGPLVNAANENERFTDVVMDASGDGQTALAVLGWHSRRLGTVDLCTGRVTVGATLSRANTATLVVEGLARRSDGTWFVSSGNSAGTLSNAIGTLDVGTGVITNLSATTIASIQNDTDGIFFRDDVLYGVDIATANNRTDLFRVDLTTGAATNTVTSLDADEPLRFSYDGSRGKVFSWRAGDRNLLEVNLSELKVTPLGSTHTNAATGAEIRGFFVAPQPNCST